MSLHAKSNETSSDWKIVIHKKYTAAFENFEHRYPNYYKKINDFLTTTPNIVVRGRVFPLRGEKYRGAWEYKEELYEGTFRIYYKLITADRIVIIYYIGQKPIRSPFPPADFLSTSDCPTSSLKDDRRRATKKRHSSRFFSE